MITKEIFINIRLILYLMRYYILKPRKDFLDEVKDSGENLDMIVEGTTILGILTDTHRFPRTQESIEEYIIRVPEQTIEFKLKTELNNHIFEYLSNYWEIEKK